MPSAAQVGPVVDHVLLPRPVLQPRELLRLEAREGSRRSTLANKNRTDRVHRYGKVGMPVIGPFSYMVLAFMKGIISIFGHKHMC